MGIKSRDIVMRSREGQDVSSKFRSTKKRWRSGLSVYSVGSFLACLFNLPTAKLRV